MAVQQRTRVRGAPELKYVGARPTRVRRDPELKIAAPKEERVYRTPLGITALYSLLGNHVSHVATSQRRSAVCRKQRLARRSRRNAAVLFYCNHVATLQRFNVWLPRRNVAASQRCLCLPRSIQEI